jgi:hypothetical protein
MLDTCSYSCPIPLSETESEVDASPPTTTSSELTSREAESELANASAERSDAALRSAEPLTASRPRAASEARLRRAGGWRGAAERRAASRLNFNLLWGVPAPWLCPAPALPTLTSCPLYRRAFLLDVPPTHNRERRQHCWDSQPGGTSNSKATSSLRQTIPTTHNYLTRIDVQSKSPELCEV